MAKRFRNRYIDIGAFCDTDGQPSSVFLMEEEIISKDHSFILSFLNENLYSDGGAGTLLEKYFENVIGRGAVYEVPETVLGKISSLHPYFKRNAANTSVLLNRIISSVIRFYVSGEEPQKKLMSELFVRRGLGDCDASYWLDSDPGIFPALPMKDCMDPVGEMQDRVRTAVIMLIDGSSEILADAAPAARMALYNMLAGNSGIHSPFVEMRSLYCYPMGKNAADLSARLEFAGQDDALSLDRLCADIEEFAKNPKAGIRTVGAAIAGFGNTENILRAEILVPSSFENLLMFEVMEMFEGRTAVRRNDCGQFLIPGDGAGDGSEDISAIVEKMYATAYKTHHRRMKSAGTAKADLDEWRKTARTMMARVVDGTLSLSEFSMWLKI